MSDQEDLFNNSSSSNSEKEKTSIKKVSTKKAKPKKKLASLFIANSMWN